MRMLHISHMDDLIANSMNILEPAPVDAQGNEREDGSVLLSMLPPLYASHNEYKPVLLKLKPFFLY